MSAAETSIWPDPPEDATGPLRGVRVLDLTTVIMGPTATQMLGDLGADVVKIETAAGDTMRWIGPWRHAGMGPLFLQCNRNKRSVVLDLKSPEGQAAIRQLIGRADVLVSNVRPQGLARLGLDYAQVRLLNPAIIYCAAVGYGAGGPDAGKAVYDDLMQAVSGISGLFQAIDGTPRYTPVNICDRIVGLHASNAITAALFHRARTGVGQEIEVPMFETMAQFVLGDHISGGAFVPPEGPMGYKRLLSPSRGPYATRDGYIAAVVYTTDNWKAFAREVGQPDLLEVDPRFATQENRTRNAVEMGQFIAGHMRTRTTAEWLARLHAIDIPASPVNAIDDLFHDPHLKAVGLFEEIEHPTEGKLAVTRHPVRYSETPASIRRLAPNLGEHTAEILGRVDAPETGAADVR